jgi:hypothetical protein
MKTVRILVHTWLVLDFFGDARRTGGHGSTLTTSIFAQSFLALVFAALLYPETPPVPFAAANLSLSSLLIAVGVLGDHDQLARRRADQVLLATSPVRRGVVVLARGGHAAFYVCLSTIGMALPPAILLAFLRQDAWQVPGYVAAACACSGLASALLAVSLRLANRWLGQGRTALLAGTGKALLLAGGLVLFALSLRRLQQDVAALPIGRAGAELLPTYHAARLLAAPLAESWRVLPFLAGALVLALLAAAAGEAETARREAVRGDSMVRRLLRRLAGTGPRLGIAEFVATSTWRSPGFRARVLPLLGLPAGMVFLSLADDDARHRFVLTCLLLQLPAIYLPFLIAFLPRSDQPEASWVFAQAPPLPTATVRDATWRALVTHVLLPVHALALVLLFVLGGAPSAATAASLFAFGLAILAARPMLATLDVVPFTQRREADAGTDLGSLFTFALLLGGAGTAFGILLSPAARWIAAAATMAAAVALLATRREPAADAPCTVPAAEGAGDGTPAAASSPSPVSAQAPARERDPSGPKPPEASLRRELRAIAVLYVVLCALPGLVGAMFAP